MRFESGNRLMPSRSLRLASYALLFLSFSTGAVVAARLEVGPGKTYDRLSQAVAASKPGDLIEVAAADYTNDWAKIRTPNLTIRGIPVDGKRPRLVTSGAMIDNGKGMLVAQGTNLTVENIEFTGARVRDGNGCGIMSEAADLTVRHCRFYDCEDGIRGGAGSLLVEYSEFDHCGHSAVKVATHSLYIHQNCAKLTFRYNWSHHSLGGHLLKSRAAESWITYNRLTDEDGKGSAVVDLPDGGVAVVIGNVLHKGPKGDNNRMIMFGAEGLKRETNALYVANNSMWWDNRRPKEMSFVNVNTKAFAAKGSTVPAGEKDVRVVIVNNVCAGVIPLTNHAKPETAGNLVFKTVAEAGFADAAGLNFALKSDSPCIDKGVVPAVVPGIALKPVQQYVFPCGGQVRADDGKPDAGAFEYVPGK